MPAEIICDGCGKRASITGRDDQWFKPEGWFVRSDEDGNQVACSRACIKIISEQTGKTKVVLPI